MYKICISVPHMYKESAVLTAFVPYHMTLISHNMVREVADYMVIAQRV